MKDNEKKKYIVSFPHIGNYYVPIYNWLNNIIDKDIATIKIPPKISNKTLELGSAASPDFVCVPFKYTLGTFIEALDLGANVIVQAGGGCRFGYYGEVQMQILKDLGYDFTPIILLSYNNIKPIKIYNKFKFLNPKLKFIKFIYQFGVSALMTKILDEFEEYIRDNITLARDKNEFLVLQKRFYNKLKYVKNFRELLKIKKEYFMRLHKIKLIEKDNEKECLKVGIIGELYTSMEPFSTFNLEKELSNLEIKFKRYTTVTYLLFTKPLELKRLIRSSKKYIDFELGADGTISVAHALELINKGYDGIIHTKPFGCTPEENAIPILQKISRDYDIPIMYLTFDSQTSETGIKTRIEAFYDMLKMKKEKSMTKVPVLNETNI